MGLRKLGLLAGIDAREPEQLVGQRLKALDLVEARA